MRGLILAAALALGACSDEAPTVSAGAEDVAGGYTMEVRAVQSLQTYVITAPDGRVVAARATEGVSALLDADATRALGAAAPINGEEAPEVFALRMPGVNIAIGGNDAPNGDRATIAIEAGGRTVHIDAAEDGVDNGRANVRITGASESDVREFIAKADELSPAVQAEMLAALALN